ncbi:hypothetical protein [Streptomyces sp. NPDC050856]
MSATLSSSADSSAGRSSSLPAAARRRPVAGRRHERVGTGAEA